MEPVCCGREVETARPLVLAYWGGAAERTHTPRCIPRPLPPVPCLLPLLAALHLAADTGQCDSVARLVALGAPVDVASNKGQTPLALALMKVRAAARSGEGLTWAG